MRAVNEFNNRLLALAMILGLVLLLPSLLQVSPTQAASPSASPKLMQTQDANYRITTHEVTTPTNYVWVTANGNFSVSKASPWVWGYSSLFGNASVTAAQYGITEGTKHRMTESNPVITVTQKTFNVNVTETFGSNKGYLNVFWNFTVTPKTGPPEHTATYTPAHGNNNDFRITLYLASTIFHFPQRDDGSKVDSNCNDCDGSGGKNQSLDAKSHTVVNVASSSINAKTKLLIDMSKTAGATVTYGQVLVNGQTYQGIVLVFGKNVRVVDPSIVQESDNTSGTTCVFASNVSANSMLVLEVTQDAVGAASAITVSDTRSSTWTKQVDALQFNAQKSFMWLFYARVPTSGADTITISTSVNMNTCFEITGARNSITSSTNTGTGTAASVASYTPASSALVFGEVAYTSNTQPTAGGAYVLNPASCPGEGSNTDNLCTEVWTADGTATTTPMTIPNVAWGEAAYYFLPQDVQPVVAQARGSTAQQTVTLSGCGPSPITFTGDGASKNINADPSCTMTLTLPSGYHWQSSGTTTTTVATCASGTCTTFTRTYLADVPVVKATKTCSFSASPSTCTFAGNVPKNDTVVLGVLPTVAGTAAISAVSDGASNTYTAIASFTLLSTVGSNAVYCADVGTAGTLAVSVTGPTAGILVLYDINSAASSCATTGSDSSVGFNAGSTSPSVGSYTPSDDSLVMGFLNSGCQVACTVSAGASYTLNNNVNNGAALQASSESISNAATAETTPFTLSVSSPWSLVSISLLEFGVTEPTVTQPATCTTDNSGTQPTLTLVGGNPTSTTLACDGASHNITVDKSSTLTYEVPADSTNTRDRFATTVVIRTVLSCASGTCTADAFTVYFQLQNTYQVTAKAQATFDALTAPTVIGTLSGTGSATLATITINSGDASDSATGWGDYNRLATLGTATLGGAAANTDWSRSGAGAFTQTTGGNTNNVNYYKRGFMTSSYSIADALGVCSAPVLTYQSIGVTGTTATLTTATATIKIDWGTAPTVTNPLTGSISSERCVTTFSVPAISAGGTINPAYKHQDNIQNPGGLSIARTNNGTSGTVTATSFFADATTGISTGGFTLSSIGNQTYVNKFSPSAFILFTNSSATGINDFTSASPPYVQFTATKVHAILGFSGQTINTVIANGVAASSSVSGAVPGAIFKASGTVNVNFIGSSSPAPPPGPGGGTGGGGGAPANQCATNQVLNFTTYMCQIPKTVNMLTIPVTGNPALIPTGLAGVAAFFLLVLGASFLKGSKKRRSPNGSGRSSGRHGGGVRSSGPRRKGGRAD